MFFFFDRSYNDFTTNITKRWSVFNIGVQTVQILHIPYPIQHFFFPQSRRILLDIHLSLSLQKPLVGQSTEIISSMCMPNRISYHKFGSRFQLLLPSVQWILPASHCFAYCAPLLIKWHLQHRNVIKSTILLASGEDLDGAYINFALGNLEGRGDPAATVALNP